ncbi:PAS domain-containing sensor histidine kinase [Thalassobacter stenotrophicus]|nr:PAS domain-containing sensor histidine kinase [Thalassobacter stenotrophicus]UYP69100.1 PAS domain-containing sensor histidine kinase [Thalassobacter stenotrophicus]
MSMGLLSRMSLWRRQRRVQTWITLGLVALGPVLVIATFGVLGPLGTDNAAALRGVLLLDLVYILVVATLVLMRVARMVSARRARSAGSRLHMRLTFVFSGMALVPTILVAVFATFTINIGLEGWFSDRVRLALGNSVDAAQAYAQEHRDNLIQDANGLAGYLNVAKQSTFFLSDADLRQILTQGQDAVQRGLQEAYVIDGSGELRSRGTRSYLFDFEPLSTAQLEEAASGRPLLVEDKENNEFRVVVKLNSFVDRYLYVTREVDGAILSLLDETQATVQLYRQLEADRGRLFFDFGMLYLAFALILILAAVWLGLWFAEGLSRPVGRLAGAAQRVGQGDLDVRVIEERDDDEIAMLGRLFNQMTRQLKGQRDALVETNMQTERRRRLFDSVLGSVTAGVIGLDAQGRVDFQNRSAMRLLHLSDEAQYGRALADCVPEFAALFERLKGSGSETVQEELRLTRGGKLENLLVRLAKRRGEEGQLEGYVVAFDDVTELVSAQRMAAWGDVARRIAHEIKNPLTPIQLSAERVSRKFGPMLGDEGDNLRQYTDVIVRQTNDLRRIVDEFSKFARMPEPERRQADLAALLRDTIVLQRPALDPVPINADITDRPVLAAFDGTMIGQAFTNLIKNAGEAIESLDAKGLPDGHEHGLQVNLQLVDSMVEITIADTGIGLPEDRARLFEPYVTTRDKGTGLGLSIVKKIIEEHGGTLELRDAPAMFSNSHVGAAAVIRLPLLKEPSDGENVDVARTP